MSNYLIMFHVEQCFEAQARRKYPKEKKKKKRKPLSENYGRHKATPYVSFFFIETVMM